MEQKTRLPKLGTPEYYQFMWDCYYLLTQGMRAGIKLVEIRFLENLTEDEINEQIETKQKFENELKNCENQLYLLRTYTPAIPRVPPCEQPKPNIEAIKPKRKNWLIRLFGR